MPDRALEGRTAIVTGAGRGIGLAIARRLLHDGARVMLCDLTAAAADTACSSLDAGNNALAFAGDLADEQVAARLVHEADQAWGKIDILINNAGGGILRPFLDHTPDSLRQTIDRNLWTAIWCCWHVLPLMKRAGYGRIVSLGADSVRNGLVDHAGYNAAKGGVHAMTTGLAREFARDGITVNTVAPCVVATQQVEDIRVTNPKLIDDVTGIIPMGRPASETEVASMVAYLAGPEATFITGQVISVNGGTTML